MSTNYNKRKNEVENILKLENKLEIAKKSYIEKYYPDTYKYICTRTFDWVSEKKEVEMFLGTSTEEVSDEKKPVDDKTNTSPTHSFDDLMI